MQTKNDSDSRRLWAMRAARITAVVLLAIGCNVVKKSTTKEENGGLVCTPVAVATGASIGTSTGAATGTSTGGAVTEVCVAAGGAASGDTAISIFAATITNLFVIFDGVKTPIRRNYCPALPSPKAPTPATKCNPKIDELLQRFRQRLAITWTVTVDPSDERLARPPTAKFDQTAPVSSALPGPDPTVGCACKIFLSNAWLNVKPSTRVPAETLAQRLAAEACRCKQFELGLEPDQAETALCTRSLLNAEALPITPPM